MSFKDYLNVYSFDCTLPGSGEKVEFKPLTTKEIKKLLVYENDDDYSKVEEMLDQVINSSVLNENFDVDNLYLQDRFSLLLEIRKKTKGENYEFTYPCPKCKSQNYISQNLDNLPIKTLDENVDNEIKLTDDISINVWHLTRKEEKEALEKVDKKSPDKNSFYHLNILTQTIKAVSSPDGKEEDLSYEDKEYIIDNINTDNLKKISDWFDENKFGVDFVIEKKCKQCGHSEKSMIPLENFFF